ncbi:hypothetical protein EVAR_37617_1 [Eumeta japonica]|uniref:Uncharacterized protein n=1 Tax=Eumeta variegata TaxID=151549 RepID=A0A4C1VMA3_EUMVA|nr:hypothetical protein EVAR_37617_1 [Eumeta japonica]
MLTLQTVLDAYSTNSQVLVFCNGTSDNRNSVAGLSRGRVARPKKQYLYRRSNLTVHAPGGAGLTASPGLILTVPTREDPGPISSIQPPHALRILRLRCARAPARSPYDSQPEGLCS